MKKNRCIQLFLVMIVITACLSMVSPALASWSMSNGRYVYDGPDELNDELYSLPPFKFEIHHYGIGYGPCPVYTAPSESSYRCAGGGATCDTNAKMDDAGYVSGWLLVRYETNSGGVRVGYIPPKFVRGFESSMYPHFGYVPAAPDSTIYVTDNPMMHGTSFAVLEPGEQFHILSRYDYYKKNGLEWWYIECNVDGQLAYGFIEMASDFHLGSTTGY